MSQKLVFNLVFNEDYKMEMESAIFVPFAIFVKKQKNPTFVRFSDYYLNIPLWAHNFLNLLHWDSYALILLSLAYQSDI
jgi:hypothetical protein